MFQESVHGCFVLYIFCLLLKKYLLMFITARYQNFGASAPFSYKFEEDDEDFVTVDKRTIAKSQYLNDATSYHPLYCSLYVHSTRYTIGSSPLFPFDHKDTPHAASSHQTGKEEVVLVSNRARGATNSQLMHKQVCSYFFWASISFFLVTFYYSVSCCVGICSNLFY